MTKILLFKVDGGGNLIYYSFDKIIARENHVNVIRVESPLPATTIVYANIDVRQSQSKTRSVYLKSTGETTQDGWNVFESELKAPIIEHISRHRAMPIGLSLSFSNRVMPKLALDFKGYFNLDNLLPITANEGEFYIAKGGIFNDEFYYEFADKNIGWLKGDIAFWYDGKWRKSNYKMVANMSTVDIAVEGSVETNKLVEDNDPLILVLAGDLAEFREEMDGFSEEIDEKLKDVIFNDTESVAFSRDRIDDELFIEANVKEDFVKLKAREELQNDLDGKATKHEIDQFNVPYRSESGVGEPNSQLGVSTNADPNSVVLRRPDGTVRIGDAQNNNDAINKKLFDLGQLLKVDKTTKVAGLTLDGDILMNDLVDELRVATESLKGLMSATDKARLNDLWAIFDNGEDESFVDTITELLAIFSTYPEGVDVISMFATKVTKNEAIVGATKTKITYDEKGLVTSGADLSKSDIPNIDAEQVNVTHEELEATDLKEAIAELVEMIDDVEAGTPNIPNVKVTNGTAESGKYVSEIKVDETDKHEIIVVKENLPSSVSDILLEIEDIEDITQLEEETIVSQILPIIDQSNNVMTDSFKNIYLVLDSKINTLTYFFATNDFIFLHFTGGYSVYSGQYTYTPKYVIVINKYPLPMTITASAFKDRMIDFTTDILTDKNNPNKTASAKSVYDFVDVNYYDKTAVDNKVEKVIKPSGSLTAGQLVNGLLIKANFSNAYNITEEFTTTSDFLEGAGKTYPAGTNVVIVDIGDETYKFDVWGGLVDLSGYALISNDRETDEESTTKSLSVKETYALIDDVLGDIDSILDDILGA